MSRSFTAIVVSSVISASLSISGCGVKGKPLPPLEPAEIGRGAPTYKRAAEQAKPSVIPGVSTPKASPTPGRDR